jgi:hypothetical protein
MAIGSGLSVTKREIGFLLLIAAFRVKIISKLISHLASRAATAILAPFYKPSIPIGANNSFVQFSAAYVVHAICSGFMSIIFYKAKSAGSELVFVKAHHNSADFADFRKELPDLFFARKEGQIAYIDRS